METQTVGRILVTVKGESLRDLYMVEKGLLPAEQVRSLEVHDWVADAKDHRLISNPEHGGEHMLDMY